MFLKFPQQICQCISNRVLKKISQISWVRWDEELRLALTSCAMNQKVCRCKWRCSSKWCGGCSSTSAYNLMFHLSLNVMFSMFYKFVLTFLLCQNNICDFASLLDWFDCLLDFFCNRYIYNCFKNKGLLCAFIFITNCAFCKWNYLLKREVPLSKLRFGKSERMLQKDKPHLLCESFCYWTFFYIHKHDILFPCVKPHFK